MSSSGEQSTTETPLPVRHRRDLLIKETGTKDVPRWTIKDPISERFFQLQQNDYFVFQQLTGTISLADIQRRFFASHAPRKLSEEQILTFIQQLYAQGLIEINRHGTSKLLANRAGRLRTAERTQRLSNLLAIRFRGFDPDRLLERVLPWVSWIFSPALLIVSLLLGVSAASIIIAEWEVMYRELPHFGTFLQSGQFLWFLGVMAVVKVFHELAHAIACKRFGGECHELGVMLLAFTPCLYCNVSDAWLLRNRWHRIAISGAGIYVEMVLAALCAHLWYWSVPGVFHSICLNLLVVSSVSTVLLNGNPLLRYDGYYILSDLVSVPNLRTRSQHLVITWIQKLFLGSRSPGQLRELHFSRFFMGLYGIASGFYIWIVVFAILWMLYQFVEPYGLETAVVILGILILGSRITGLVRRVFISLKQTHQQGQLHIVRFLTVSGLAGICLIGILLLQFPRRLSAPCLIESQLAESVFVSSPGRANFVNASAGQAVSKGETLVQLTNRDLELQVLSLQGKVDQQQKRIDLLQQRQISETSAAAELPSARTALEDFKQQLKERQADLQRLTLKAPISGIILPADTDPQRNSAQAEFQMQATPIAQHNAGAWLEVGTVFCRIATSGKFAAILYFEQADAILLSPGTKVSLTTSQTGGESLHGEILEVAAEPLDSVPPVLIREERIPVEVDEHGALRPAKPTYEVRVLISQNDVNLSFGQTGTAVVQLEPETILKTLVRLIQQTLTFEL